jgi:hypothetical protein
MSKRKIGSKVPRAFTAFLSTIPTTYDILKSERCYLVMPLRIAMINGRNYLGDRELAHCYVLEWWGPGNLGWAL